MNDILTRILDLRGPAPKPVVRKGDFPFAAVRLDHKHIHPMCRGLVEAGGELRKVYDPDPRKMDELLRAFPGAAPADSERAILDDPEIRLVAAAAVPNERGPLGCTVMEHGKDYFTDKAPFTRLDQLEEARRTVDKTGRKYMVYYAERLHVESAVAAGYLIRAGIIGTVISVVGLGPHRLNAPTRPGWFFEIEKYGGILCDIGSHQVEQILFFTGSADATVLASVVANHANPQHPELEDHGEVALRTNTGATGFFRVDWFTPDGLSTWGDGRTFIVGTSGTIELRKYLDVGRSREGDHLFLVDSEGEHHAQLAGKIGCPFFGQLILDCLNRTEKAMRQEHAFKAAEISLRAQQLATKI